MLRILLDRMMFSSSRTDQDSQSKMKFELQKFIVNENKIHSKHIIIIIKKRNNGHFGI